jgi:hypothetical protein
MTDREKWIKSFYFAIINSILFAIIFFSFVPNYSKADINFVIRCVLPTTIIPFVILIISARLYIQNQLYFYLYIDKQVKSESKPFLGPLQKKINSIMNKELAEFYERGYY